MRVHFLTQGREDPATRFRVEAFLPGLEAQGLEVRWDVIPPGGRTRRQLLEATATSDVVVLQRRLFNLRDQQRLRRHARRLVFDFDDAVMFKDRGKGSLTRSGRFSRMVRQADLVIAGNAYLADVARQYSRRVEVLPTVVDTARFAPGPHQEGPVRLGWIGSRSTVGYLLERWEVLTTAAIRLQEQGVVSCVEVVADELAAVPEHAGPAPVQRTRWSPEVEVPALQRFHLGLMPLPDDPWSRGKCGFKLLQYLSCGVAAVADPVGVNAEILAPSDAGVPVGGLLPRTVEEWVETLVALGASPAQREELGDRGRARVLECYSLQYALPRLLELLERTHREAPG